MKVSISWLKELVDLKVPLEETVELIPLRTIGTKEITPEYIELDMKGYNRADLLSMRGVAYEIASLTGSSVTFDELKENEYIWYGKNLPKTRIKVQDSKLCPLYCIAKIDNLKVSLSNPAIAKKLRGSGIRAVNNVADITNLIMLEYGQPLHAFDAARIRDETLIVRRAQEDEEIMTLDAKVRKLSSSDLLITDPEKAVGIAGVMGGKNSEVTDMTTSILLESAIFDGANLRKTANRLNLPSEASKRFQHGLTRKRLLEALDAAIRVYQSLGGKLTALSIVGETEDPIKKIRLTKQKIYSLIGVEIPEVDVKKYLEKLNFQLDPKGKGVWEVTVPYFRLDIEIEEDLIEEVARMYGYEKIPAKELPGQIPPKIDQSLFKLIYKLKTTLVNLGLTEVQTYSFYSSKVINDLRLKIDDLVKIQNPISSETEYMRNFIFPNLLEVVAKNLKQGFSDIAIFELGKIYDQIKGSRPKESYSLTLALTNQTDNPLAELNLILRNLSKKIDLEVNIELDQAPEIIKHLSHPKRFLKISFHGNKIGGLAEIHPRILDKFGIDKRVAILEINLKS